MISQLASEAAAALGAELIGDDCEFNGVGIDGRTIEQGELFVAVAGERFDGHDFIEQARSQGAACVMVSRRVPDAITQILVTDTRLALGRLAAQWRQRCSATVVALTGSNGKTTTKEMIAAILHRRGVTLSTRGNLNNDLGVPLTLLRLSAEHRYAVIEMGANHAGEIAYLTGLTRPDVALITNAGAAHLEGFGSIEGVGHAKGEIFSGLRPGGVAIINRDDAMAPLWQRLAAGVRTLHFGLGEPAEVGGQWRAGEYGVQLHLRTPAGAVDVRLPVPGQHNVMNALAAAAAAQASGATLDDIRHGLETLQPVAGRLQLRMGFDDMRILDDTYNANPASLQAALEVLITYAGAKWLALGDMAELGVDGANLHERAGRLARTAGVARLFALGELSRGAVASFGAGADHFSDWRALAAAVRAEWKGPGTLLVKGSRSMHMERVIEALTQKNGPAAAGNGGH